MNIIKRSFFGLLYIGVSSLGLFFIAPPQAVAQASVGMLFAPITLQFPRSASASSTDKQVIRSREMSINLPQVVALGSTANKDVIDTPTVILNLFEDASFTAVASEVTKTERGFSWTGRLVGVQDSAVVLAVSNGIVSGNITMPDARFHIRYVQPGMYRIEQIDSSQFPPDHPPSGPLSAPDKVSALKNIAVAQADDGSMIDVLVVYTAAARAAAGGTAAITTLIDLAVAESNMAYQNSGISQRVRVVRSEEVAFSESLNKNPDVFAAALNCITSKTDGCLDSIHTTRNTYGADLVSFWIEDATACGLGWVNSDETLGFSVTTRGCATGNYSFSHEMGHNSGAKHDTFVDSSTTPLAYAHGLVNVPGKWRTIMSYNTACVAVGVDCTRIQYFSNPTVSFNGRSTGITGSADNSRVLNGSALSVANFRASVNSGTSTPTAPSIDISGIYQSISNAGLYMTAYKNNNTLITTTYSGFLSSTLFLKLAGGYINPEYIDYFTVLNGTVNGLQGAVSGYDNFRTCNISVAIAFTATTATSTITASSASASGVSQNIACQVADKVGTVLIWKKIL